MIKCKMNSKIKNNKENNYNYSQQELGCVLKLKLTSKQKTKINQFLGCVRKVKNNKIAEINTHNKHYLNIDNYNEFKLNNPTLNNDLNPYKYIYPTQGYANSKHTGIDFIGPLQEEVYNNIYHHGKHYLERVPSELYRNSIKDLILANNKFISDVFNKKIPYANKRKSLNFISKNKYQESLLLTSSDNIFKFIQTNNISNDKSKDNNNYVLCFGKNFEENYQLEQEINSIKDKINHSSKYNDKSNSKNELKELTKKLNKLTVKLEKEISYLGMINFHQLKKNKSTKKIDYDSIKSIRIKKDKDNYYLSFTYSYYNEYKPTLLRLDNNKELTTVEELALYVKELTEKKGLQVALDYLKERVLGIDRGITERLALSNSNSNSNSNRDLNDNKENLKEFLSYSEKIKKLIIKIEKSIKYHDKQLKRRTKGSKGYNYSLKRSRKLYKKIADIKLNENHQVTKTLVKEYDFPIIAIEKLNLKGMSKKPLPKIEITKTISNKNNIKLGLTETILNELSIKIDEYNKENKNGLKYSDIVGKYKIVYGENKAAAKAGLNKGLVGSNLGQFANILNYKTAMNGKIMIEVPAGYSSQECNECGSIDSKNRTKTKFCCVACGNKDHADSNASKVIAGRVYKELMKIVNKILAKKAKAKNNLSKDSKSNKIDTKSKLKDKLTKVM